MKVKRKLIQKKMQKNKKFCLKKQFKLYPKTKKSNKKYLKIKIKNKF
jgi:hypothetical protein